MKQQKRHRPGQVPHSGDAGLQALVDAAVDPIVIIDGHGIVLTFNPAAERAFGYAAADIEGRNVSVLMPSPDREGHDGYIRRYLETGQRKIIGVGREVEALRADGTTFPVRLAVAEVLREGEGWFVGTMHDLTRQKESERALREQEAAFRELQEQLFRASRVTDLGEMAAAIAHELNQPLSAIGNYSEAARARLARAGADPGVGELLSKVAAQAERAGTIIRSLRELIGRNQTEMDLIDINEAVQEALDLALVGAKELGVAVKVSLASSLPEVLANRTQIQQVVFNLVRIGLDAMAETDERHMLVETVVDGESLLRVAVTDTGPGIDPEVKQRLFTPFTTSKPDGMGLGLSICRSIVESHGGTIRAEPGDGRGTRFYFTLPPGVRNA